MSAAAGSARAGGTAHLGGWALSSRVPAFLVVFMVATVYVATGTLETQSVVLVAAVFAMLAVSLDLAAGMTGLYSLGHAGLFAFGAYGTTILNAKYHWGIWQSLPVIVIGVAVIGLLLGGVSLRVSGLYFAVTSFIFTLVITVTVRQLTITGGPQGLIGPLFPSFPASLAGLGDALTWCVMLSLLLTMAVVWCIRHSTLYPVLLSIRDAQPFAASAGVRTSAVTIGVFGVSAGLAGFAGWAFSFLGVVSPSQFDWTISVNILVMAIFGGLNTTLGPVIGAALISGFPSVVSISPLWQEVIYGALFLVVIVFFPQGITGVARAVTARVVGGRQGPSTARDLGGAAPVMRREPLRATGPTSRGSDETPAIECTGVAFRYARGLRVLDGVDLRVMPGTIHGLIGPNGSGKSTLVDLIAGRQRPEAGAILVEGQSVNRRGASHRAGLGVRRTFQAPVLVDELDAQTNAGVGLYSSLSGVAVKSAVWPLLPGSRKERRQVRARALETLEWAGVGAWAATSMADAPHGVHQLTQLAATYISDPRTLILDEPLAGLSPGEAEHVAEILRSLREQGVSVILIEHQTRFVFSLCDEVTVLSAGQVVATGPAAEILTDTRVREVYLGQ